MSHCAHFLSRLLCATTLFGAALPAHGISLCVSDRPAAPLTFPDHEGQAQYLVRTAVQASGETAQFVVLPWRRCIESLRAGQVDAALGAQAFNAFKDFVKFPLKNGVPDRAFSIGIDTWVVVSLKDSAVSWDGAVLHGVTTPVSYPAGVNVVRQTLDTLNIQNIDSAKTALQLMQMIKFKRYDAVVIRESDAQGFLAQEEFHSLHILAPTFLKSDAYLVFGNGFAQANPALVTAVWDGIRRIRSSREWADLAPALAK